MTHSLLLMASPLTLVTFEKGPDERSLPEWSVHHANVEVEDIQSEGLSVIDTETAEHPTALRIVFHGSGEILRMTRDQDPGRLQPNTEYELQVVARIPLTWSGEGGGCRVFVTDTRWEWQSPKLEIREESPEWTTYTLRFSTPQEMAHTGSRIRIEFGGVGDAEIAEISLQELGAPNAEETPPLTRKELEEAPLELTLEKIEENNLVPNSKFSKSIGSALQDWSYHPHGATLITVSNSTKSTEENFVELEPGAGSLMVISEPIPVTPGEPYSLVVDLKQEETPIGFEMGGQLQFHWLATENGSRQPQVLDLLDGSFDWRTLSYSVDAPADAKFVRILLQKKGSPGRVAYRNVRFARGIFQRAESDLTAKDLFADREAFQNLDHRVRYFLADKSDLIIPGIPALQAAVSTGVEQHVARITSALQQKEPGLSHDEEFEVKWAEMLKGNLGFKVRPDSPNYTEWKALESKVDTIKETVTAWLAANNRERLKEETTRLFGQYSGYSLGLDSPMIKVLRDSPYTGKPTATASISLARNEEESVQMTLSALDADLEDISIEVGPLESNHGEPPPQDLLSVSRIDFVETSPPQYYVDAVGWWPDIVFPENTVGRIPQGTNQPFWITASADSETPPGDYTTNIVVKSRGQILQTIPLHVRVWDITLPKPGKFKVVGRFSPNQLSEFYQWDKPKEDVLAAWNRYIFAKRWNSTDPFATFLTPRGESLQAAAQEGLNSIILLNASQLLERDRESRTYTWPDAAREKMIKERIESALSEFKATAGDSEATLYVFGFDEQHDRGQFPLMKHIFDLVKKTAPNVRIMTTTTYSPLEELVGSVDTWVPLLGQDTEELRQRQEAGDELFFYIYAHPFHPYPNAAQVDYLGIDGRISFWLAARQGYVGFLHWLMNGWFANSDTDERWPDIDWHPRSGHNFARRNGEGYFLYPGPDEQPISSIRFELVRDGIEDWELINLLRETIAQIEETNPDSPALPQARQALAEGMVLVPALDSYNLDTQRLMAAREQIANALLALQSEASLSTATI